VLGNVLKREREAGVGAGGAQWRKCLQFTYKIFNSRLDIQ
jgi:hypothetical protein